MYFAISAIRSSTVQPLACTTIASSHAELGHRAQDPERQPSQLVQRIGQRVYAARVQAGLKQFEVGQQASVTGPYISRLERGLVAHPRVIDLRRIAHVLGLTFEQLISDDATDGASKLQAALVDVTGDPRLSSQITSLARHWGLVSISERQRLFAALGHALSSIQADGIGEPADGRRP